MYIDAETGVLKMGSGKLKIIHAPLFQQTSNFIMGMYVRKKQQQHQQRTHINFTTVTFILFHT